MERLHARRSTFVVIALALSMAPIVASADVKVDQGTTAVKVEPVLAITPTPIKPAGSTKFRADRSSARALASENAARNQFLQLHARRLEIEAQLSPQVRDVLRNVAREDATAMISPSTSTLAAIASHVRAQLPNAAPDQLSMLTFVAVDKALELSVGVKNDGEVSMVALQTIVDQRAVALQVVNGLMQTMDDSMKAILKNMR